MAVQVKIKNQAETTTVVTLDKDAPHVQLQTANKYAAENIAIQLEGADFTDATATASQIISGYTAYISGGDLVTGTLDTWHGEKVNPSWEYPTQTLKNLSVTQALSTTQTSDYIEVE